MVLLIPKDVIFAAGERADYSEIDTEAGRVDHYVFFADIFGDARLELLVKVKGAIEERRAGAAGAIFSDSVNRSLFDSRVIDQSGIAVRTEHEDFTTIDGNFGVLLGVNSSEVGINACGLGLLRLVVSGKFLLKQLHIFWFVSE